MTIAYIRVNTPAVSYDKLYYDVCVLSQSSIDKLNKLVQVYAIFVYITRQYHHHDQICDVYTKSQCPFIMYTLLN